MTGRAEARMQAIRCRTRKYRQKQENRKLSCLTACSLLLVTAIYTLFANVQALGIADVTDGYSAVLLRNGVSAYVLVGIAAFILGVSVTMLCIRLKNKSKPRTKNAEEREETV